MIIVLLRTHKYYSNADALTCFNEHKIFYEKERGSKLIRKLGFTSVILRNDQSKRKN